MRSLRMATCTSGDPVSASCVLYEPISSVLRSFDNATGSSSTRPPVPPVRAGSSADTVPDGPSTGNCCYSNKINMLHQDNSRVQKPGGRSGLGDADQVAVRIDQPDESAGGVRRDREGVGAELASVNGAPHPVRRQAHTGQLREHAAERDDRVERALTAGR